MRAPPLAGVIRTLGRRAVGAVSLFRSGDLNGRKLRGVPPLLRYRSLRPCLRRGQDIERGAVRRNQRRSESGGLYDLSSSVAAQLAFDRVDRRLRATRPRCFYCAHHAPPDDRQFVRCWTRGKLSPGGGIEREFCGQCECSNTALESIQLIAILIPRFQIVLNLLCKRSKNHSRQRQEAADRSGMSRNDWLASTSLREPLRRGKDRVHQSRRLLGGDVV